MVMNMPLLSACRTSVGLKRRLIVGVLVLPLLLGACMSAPPRDELSSVSVQLVIEGAADQNPDINGRASPLVVRVYELKGSTAFGSADYFTLAEREQEALGGSLLYRESFVVRPGETRRWTRSFAGGQGRALGVLASYRDLERSVWRAHVELPAPGSPLWEKLRRLVSWGEPTIHYRARLDRRVVSLRIDAD